MKHEFAIKKDTLRSGKVFYTPVYRRIGWATSWTRITRIYDEYLLMDLDFNPDITFAECEEHIAGYKKKLDKSKENEIKFVEYHKLENKPEAK